MSTISASTTSTTAYKVTADTTGALVLQTGATPTTALTIDASQNITTANKFAKASMPTGSVLQVVNATTVAGITTSSTSFVTTNFSASITPTSSTSKIFAVVNGGGAYCSISAGIVMYSTIYRNSTNLGDASYGLERHTTVGGTYAIAPHSMSVLDSPATTSSTTYTCYFRNAGTAGTVEFSGSDRGVVSLTLMEIAA